MQGGDGGSRRLLVVCVDRDDDVGSKAGVATPVVGRGACLAAAQRLALADPEDVDSNAIFAAVKAYDDLASRGHEAEVVAVAGSEGRGISADAKIAAEVREALSAFPAEGCVIVSDGEDDESVIPAIQAVAPVVSVQRVVMRTSRSVEYSYAVFAKYLRLLAYDSKYSKFFLGVPGILLLVGGVAAAFGYAAEIVAVLVSILGGAFVVRAFDIDRAWASWAKPTPSGFVRMFTTVAGGVLLAASVPAGLSAVDAPAGAEGVEISRTVAGQYLDGSLPAMWAGIGTVLAGVMLSNWLAGARRRASDVLRLAVLAALFPTMYQFASVLTTGDSPASIVPPLVAGAGATVVVAVLLLRRGRRAAGPEGPGGARKA